MNRHLSATLILSAFFLSAASVLACSPTPTATPTPTLAEDSPEWDCETMGNRICGPVTIVLGADSHATVVDAIGTWADTPDATYVGEFGYGSAAYLADVDACPTPTPSGPIGVTVLASGPRTVVDGSTRAAIVADGGRCLVAVGTVVLY